MATAVEGQNLNKICKGMPLNAVTLTCCLALLAPLCMMGICNTRHERFKYMSMFISANTEGLRGDNVMDSVSEAPFNIQAITTICTNTAKKKNLQCC
jgi:hypothetical protein